MDITEETLMAFADGEADEATRAAVEAAMRADPEIALRVAQHRALRERIGQAFAADLEEPVPARLLAAAHGPGSHGIAADLDGARRSRRRAMRTPVPWRDWRVPASMAACLVLGVALALVWSRPDRRLVAAGGTGLAAGSQLGKALSTQLAGERSSASPVIVGMSFVAKDGGYCRSFLVSGPRAFAGLACREADEWQIRLLSRTATPETGGGEFRTAGAEWPAALLAAIEAEAAGEPLDRAGEVAARARGWRARGLAPPAHPASR